MHRRELLALLGALPLTAACDRARSGRKRGGGRGAPAPSGRGPWRDELFAPTPYWQRPELVSVRSERGAPVLVALHGRGEAGRGLEAGAHGWRDDYHLDKLLARLRAPPLSAKDLGGFVTPARLQALNASLARHRYAGLTVACPYTPALADRSLRGAQPFARLLVEAILPRVRKLAGAATDRLRTGIDGVSMGGRLALLVGLSRPDIFGAVGAMQPAIAPDEAKQLAALARQANATAPLALRLVSSEGDPFRPAVEALSAALHQAKVVHQLVITPGPHDYVWNQGPGGCEMLMWHDRVLHGLPAP